MKRQDFVFGLVVAGLMSQPLAALAYDWFDKWDHNHDHNWNWREYSDARRAWEREHRDERRLTEAELRAEYSRLDADHNHRLSRQEARASGHW